jgi:hypothetical protein
LVITDVNGQEVYRSHDEDVRTKQVSLVNEAAGVYFVRVIADGSTAVFRIMVQR